MRDLDAVLHTLPELFPHSAGQSRLCGPSGPSFHQIRVRSCKKRVDLQHFSTYVSEVTRTRQESGVEDFGKYIYIYLYTAIEDQSAAGKVVVESFFFLRYGGWRLRNMIETITQDGVLQSSTQA